MRVIHLFAAAVLLAAPTAVSAAPLIEVAFDDPPTDFFDYGNDPVGKGFPARSSALVNIGPHALAVALGAKPLDRLETIPSMTLS